MVKGERYTRTIQSVSKAPSGSANIRLNEPAANKGDQITILNWEATGFPYRYSGGDNQVNPIGQEIMIEHISGNNYEYIKSKKKR